jgi:hypothetical protein
MHPVLGSSRRILARTNRRMFSGLLISTTPVAIAVVCGAHERISCFDASLPGRQAHEKNESPGGWFQVSGGERERTERGEGRRRGERTASTEQEHEARWSVHFPLAWGRGVLACRHVGA